jgi:hypothetical protein
VARTDTNWMNAGHTLNQGHWGCEEDFSPRLRTHFGPVTSIMLHAEIADRG